MILKYDFGDSNDPYEGYYEFEIDWDDICRAMKHILKDKDREELIDIIIHMDDECCEYFREEIEDYFHDDAYEKFRYGE